MLPLTDATGGVDIQQTLINLFGPAGIFLVLFITRKIRTDGEVRERDKQINELQASLNSYIEHYQKEVLPALIDVTRLSGDLLAYLNKHSDR